MEYIKSFIIDRVALAKQGDNAVGSIRPSVRGRIALISGIILKSRKTTKFRGKV